MGKQIRIHLADGDPAGIRHAEITNWTGQALACSRNAVKELHHWEELQRQGVYFLFGQDENTGEDSVYIGESENVIKRLADHLVNKNFWHEMVAFTSKDSNLTKSHIRYLESRLVEKVLAAKRCKCLNGNVPQGAVLPRADRDSMDEYLDSLEVLLGVLGHRIFQIKNNFSQKNTNISHNDLNHLPINSENNNQIIFKLKIKNIEATAQYTDQGLLVLAKSEAAIKSATSLRGGLLDLKTKLTTNKILEEKNGKFILMQDYLFSSPSSAAAILLGYAINGQTAWKLDNGKTYADYEAEIAQSLLNQN